RLRRQMITESVRIVDGRVPVLVGVTDTAFVESVRLSQHACDCGADAAVLTTPYYFPAGQTELTAYLQNIAPEIPLPLMLYNMPGLTKVWFEIDTLRTLAEIPSIIGVKDSSGDLDYFAEACRLKELRPDWSVLIGPEAMLPQAMAAGGDGGVAGGANVMPRTFVDCYESIVSDDHDALDACRSRIDAFQAIYQIGKYASRHIKATKSALSLIGICSDLPADPFHAFRQPERERVATILQEIGVL
ncbi:MAG: dihydrodipicolinate synthase family protein, partial [Planctomycetota bacterium]